MPADVNVLALCKGRERYVLLFDDARRGQALRILGRWAGNPELSFTWCDFATLAWRIKGPKDDGNTEAILARRRGDAGEGRELRDKS